LSGIRKISGGSHSGAINNENELFIWGNVYFDRFAIPVNISKEYQLQNIKNVKIGKTFGILQTISN
jgi:hypothetical protein